MAVRLTVLGPGGGSGITASGVIPIPYPAAVGSTVAGSPFDVSAVWAGVGNEDRYVAEGPVAWVLLRNDSDSLLLLLWPSSSEPCFLHPGEVMTEPVPRNDTTFTLQVVAQNPFKSHPLEVLTVLGYNRRDIANGHLLVQSATINPSVPAAAIGPGALPAGVTIGWFQVLQKGPGIFSVQDYGAIGDGVHDDAPAFRACAAAIRTAGGGIMYVPGTNGTPYLMASFIANPTYGGAGQVTAEAFWLPTGTILRGDGPTVSILQFAANVGNQTYMFTNYQAGAINPGEDEDITVENICLNGNAINNLQATYDAQYGAVFFHTRRVTIRDVVSKDFFGTTAGGNGPNGTNGESYGIGTVYCLDVKVSRLHCYTDQGQTGSGTAFNNGTHIVISDSIFERQLIGQGLAVFTFQTVEVSNCMAYLNGHAGLNFEFCTTVGLVNCAAGGIFGVVGGVAWYPAGQVLGNTATGINFQACDEVTVYGCQGSNNGGHGIAFFGTPAGTAYVTGGDYSGNTLDGVFIDSNYNHLVTIAGSVRISGNGANPIATGGTPTTCTTSGIQTAPPVPATTVPLTNPFPYACMVLVSGGTVSQIAITGANTNLTSGWFRIPRGETITLTYTAAPSWQWYTAL